MNDLISRQAAIDAVLDMNAEHRVSWVDAVIDVIDELPSAGPKIIRCRECKYGVDYYNEGDCYCSNPKWGLKYFGGSWDFYCADAKGAKR